MEKTRTNSYATKKIIAANTRFKCTEVEQNSFEDMKCLVGKHAILVYTNFSK